MLDLLMSRRSIRKYKEQEIEKEKVDKILEGALTAPSGNDKKPWELIVVNDKKTLEKLGDARGQASHQVAGASLGIVIIADPNIANTWIEDTSIISTVIQLTAQSLGLGSCWVQVRDRVNQNEENVETYVKEVLDIPEKYRVECMLSIGYPDEEKEPHNKETLSYDKVHYNSF